MNESEFGNDIYDGKYIDIPDDLAVWIMKFYSEHNSELYDFTKIPKNIIRASKKLLDRYGNDVIYRGFELDRELNDVEVFIPKNDGSNISWTFDYDTALAFSQKYDDSYIAELEYKKLKYIISVDVIMDNITQRQVNLLKNKNTIKDISGYYSESEIIVFDKVSIKKENITKI